MDVITILLLAMAQAGQATTVNGKSIQPQVVVAPDGTIHVVYLWGGNPVVSTSGDKGASWGAPAVAINIMGQAKGGLQRGPRIGVDAAGGLVVTAPVPMEELERKKYEPIPDLHLARSSDKGRTWSRSVRVNEVQGAAPEALHWLAVAPDGAAHVAWLDLRGGKDNCLWYAKVAGDKVGKNIKLTGAVCECCAPGIAIDGKGNPTIVVREGKKADRSILMTVSRNAGASFSAPAAMNTGRTGLGG